MASFKLVNGYRKTVFMTVEEAKTHGKQYSQTFKKGYGLWADNFNAMALKTTLKMLLKKFAPKSIESIAKAIESDQASFTGDIENAQPVYVDNTKEEKQGEVVEFEEIEVVDTETSAMEESEPVTSNKDDF
jgi:recombination protein RecT